MRFFPGKRNRTNRAAVGSHIVPATRCCARKPSIESWLVACLVNQTLSVRETCFGLHYSRCNSNNAFPISLGVQLRT